MGADPKSHVSRKFVDEIAQFLQTRPGNVKNVERFTDMVDTPVGSEIGWSVKGAQYISFVL